VTADRSHERGAGGRWRRFVAARLDPASYLGLRLTIGLVVLLAALWAFGALLEEVLDNETLVRLDVAASAWIHARTTPAGLALFDAITQLGSPVAMGAVALVGSVVLWRRRRRVALVTWVAAFGGGVVVDQALKLAVHRARPTYGGAYLHGHSYSFPSGHAMGSIIGYTMLVYTVHGGGAAARRTRAALLRGGAAVIVLAIGASRLYLGVHYPSDVVGGYAAGAAWLAICLTYASVTHGRTGTAPLSVDGPVTPDAALDVSLDATRRPR
jgi:undecaprenyl-diphosphatase